jgi:hypothetical protein
MDARCSAGAGAWRRPLVGLVSEALSDDEVAELASHVADKPIRYVDVGSERRTRRIRLLQLPR